MRIVIAAFMICALAFVAGVAGDLSLASPVNAGESVRMHIPAGAIRAHPLPVIAFDATDSARAAEPIVRHPHRIRHVQRSRMVKPHRYAGKPSPKVDPIVALKSKPIAEPAALI